MPKTLPSGWRIARLDDLGAIERGRSRHRPRNDPSLYGGPYPFVQTGDVKAAGLRLYDYSQTYSEAGLEQSRLWPEGTLCITIAANICDTAILGVPACFPDSIVGFTPDERVADVVFVKYLLDFTKRQFTDISRGATQDNLSVEKMLSRELRVPPLPIQRRIAAILGAYDDLIEVNRRRIAVLEEMARRLFDEWFVNFRFPGHEGQEMVETELGRIPKGWEICEVRDLVRRLPNGKVYKADDVDLDGDTLVIDQSTAELLGFHQNKPDHIATPTDPIVIFGDHTCKMQMMVRSFSLGPNTIAFASKDLPVDFIFWHVRGLIHTAEYKRHWNELMKKPVLSPPKSLTIDFASRIRPLTALSENIREQNRRLRGARDLLLPRLISGELSVATSEHELEDAA